MNRTAIANVSHLRQETQYTCCATSITAALAAWGKNITEAEVNKILGATPMAGASWEAMLATVQYFGMRGSLVVPATPRMLKNWTDQGIPVLIAWNPEGRPWSHASVVFNVEETEKGLLIHVMDPNIPNPSKTERILHEDEFCQKWYEKVSESILMRRPAMAIEREVTATGKQVVATSSGVAEMESVVNMVKKVLKKFNPIRRPTAIKGARALGPDTHYKDFSGKKEIWDRDEIIEALKEIPTLVKGANQNQYIFTLPSQIFTHPQQTNYYLIKIPPVQEIVSGYEIIIQHIGQDIAGEGIRDLKFFGYLKASKQIRGQSSRTTLFDDADYERPKEAKKQPTSVQMPKQKDKTIHVTPDAPRNLLTKQMIERGQSGGSHHNRDYDVEKGRTRKEKHRKKWQEKESALTQPLSLRPDYGSQEIDKEPEDTSKQRLALRYLAHK